MADPNFLDLKPLARIVVFAAGPLSNLFCCMLSLFLASATHIAILDLLFELIVGINLGIGHFPFF